MTQYGFFFDESRCVDCRACAMACRDWNGHECGGPRLLRRFAWEEGCFPETRMHTLFAPCYHCEAPACVPSCPNGALFKEGKYGAVLCDEGKCTGCGACHEACPYGAPRVCDGTMSKCTMCIDRLETGDMPACVNSCIVRALDFGPIDKLRAVYGDVRVLDGMPDGSLTKPAVTFRPATPKKQVVPLDARRVRELFGKRGDISPLYEGAEAFDAIDPAAVRHQGLNMKLPDAEEMDRYASEEF